MSAIERLAAMVQQAEAKASAKRLNSEIQLSAERLRSAQERNRLAEQRVREERPPLTRELEQLELDEITLRELAMKSAKFRSYLEPEQVREAETLFAQSERELKERRSTIQAELAEINRDATEARRDLATSVESYQHTRKELDRLQPHLAADFVNEDKLVIESSTFLPAGQLAALAREIADSANYFGMIDSKQQVAQLKIWIGRYRLLQESDLSEFNEEQNVRLRQIFPELVGISKRYKPGYIEAFQQNFTADWLTYIADAKVELQDALDESSRYKQLESHQRDAAVAQEDRVRRNRDNARGALEELTRLTTRGHLLETPTTEETEEFLKVLANVVSGFGTSDPEVNELVMPYREFIQGGDLRALRRNLDRMVEDEEKAAQTLPDRYSDVLELTKGKRVYMIGGAVREDSRRKLEKLFGFEELEWIAYETNRPAALDSVEQKIANRAMDFVIILKYVGHHVTERLKPVCELHHVDYFMTRSYSVTQFAETLRKGLDRTPPASSTGTAIVA